MGTPGDLKRDLLALGSATLGESGARTTHPRLKPAWDGAAVAGPACPVVCGYGDNLALHVAVAEAPAGSVLVVAAEPPERGYWGEVLTTAAESRGITGLVIDGGVRDVSALEAHRFPVFSSTVALQGASKAQAGTVWAPAVVGGAPVEPGDWVVADSDGVVFVPGSSLGDVAEAGRRRAAKESGYFDALRAGSTTVDLLGLDTSPVRREPRG
jgi:4-hydroxy-4-methyl-2-oxoglutarate aldolase